MDTYRYIYDQEGNILMSVNHLITVSEAKLVYAYGNDNRYGIRIKGVDYEHAKYFNTKEEMTETFNKLMGFLLNGNGNGNLFII